MLYLLNYWCCPTTPIVRQLIMLDWCLDIAFDTFNNRDVIFNYEMFHFVALLKTVRTYSQAVIKGLAKQVKWNHSHPFSICNTEICNHCNIVARLQQKSDVPPSESLSLPFQTNFASHRDIRTKAKSLQLQPPAEKHQTTTPAKLRNDAISEPWPDENFDFNHSLATSSRCGVDSVQ